MQRSFAILLLCACAVLHAADADVRVQVEVFGDLQIVPGVAQQLTSGFESLAGVITVKKQPDVIVSVVASIFRLNGSELVMIAAAANGTVPDGAAAALLRETTKAGIDNAQKIFNGLATVSVPFAAAGTKDELPQLCADIVSAVNVTAIENVRKYPSDPDPDKALDNFFGRIGARPVIDPGKK